MVYQAPVEDATIGFWLDTSLRDWHLPPSEKWPVSIWLFQEGAREVSIEEFISILHDKKRSFVGPGLELLVCLIAWRKYPNRQIILDALRSQRLIPLDLLEEIISNRLPDVWPAPISPTAIIEADIEASEKAKLAKETYQRMVAIEDIQKLINGQGGPLEAEGMYYDLARHIAALMCSWKGAFVDKVTLDRWIDEMSDETEREPELLENQKYKQKFTNVADIYEALLDSGRVHPSYFLDPFGRAYTEAPNLQVLRHGPPRPARSLIMAAPGYSLFYADASAANLHPLAEIWRSEYSKDPRSENLAADLENPFDIHFRTGVYILYPELFGKVKEIVTKGIPWLEAANKVGIAEPHKVRKFGKDINFAIPNGTSFATVQAQARSKGIELTKDMYDRFLRVYSKRYPIDKWKRGGKPGYDLAETLTGRTLELSEQPRWSSFRIQGTVADLFGEGIMISAIKYGAFPILWQHDAVIYEMKTIAEAERAVGSFQKLAEEWFPATTMRFDVAELGSRWEPLIE